MKPLSFLVLLAGVVLAVRLAVPGAALSGAAEPAAAGVADAGGEERPLVVVELFTSQGCSSCPPADRLLSELAADPAQRVAPLAFHVDYWNYIGWRDPFSSAEWSRRQGRYAVALGAGRRYTPQLVVDGRDDCVGSDAGCVRRLLAAARARVEAARVELDVEPADGRLLVEARVAREGVSEAGALDLVLAVVESGHVTPVGRGENARKTLHNDFVVRRLETLASVDAGEATTHRYDVALDAGWREKNLGLVVFLQDPDDLAIHGADAWSAGDAS